MSKEKNSYKKTLLTAELEPAGGLAQQISSVSLTIQTYQHFINMINLFNFNMANLL